VGKPDPSANVYKLVKQAIRGVYNMMDSLEKRVIEKIDSENGHNSALRKANKEETDAILDLIKEGSRADIQSAVTRAEALAKQQEELVKRISAIGVAQSQNQGKSSIWANPIIVGAILAVLGYLLAKFTK
jgi:hypothetical protein